MRALPLVACLSLALLAPPLASANELAWVMREVESVGTMLPYKACVDDQGARLEEQGEPCGAPPSFEQVARWAECVVDDVMGGVWPPTLQNCPEPLPAIPCLYHQWRTCYDRMGLAGYGIPPPPVLP